MINWAIVCQTLRWMWRCTTTRFLVILWGFSLLGDLPDVQFANVILLITLGVQGIGSSMRQDSIELIFTRPIPRHEFVLSKWIAFLILPMVSLVVAFFHSLYLRSPLESLTLLVHVISSSLIASAGATLMRMIVLKPTRQWLCLNFQLCFISLFSLAQTQAFNGLGVIEMTYLAFPLASLSKPLTVAGLLLSVVNAGVLLSIAYYVCCRHEPTYATD